MWTSFSFLDRLFAFTIANIRSIERSSNKCNKQKLRTVRNTSFRCVYTFNASQLNGLAPLAWPHSFNVGMTWLRNVVTAVDASLWRAPVGAAIAH